MTPDIGLLRDVAALEHLDEDWAIACELPSPLTGRIYREPAPPGPHVPACPQPAVWWLLCRECGACTAECNQHRVEEHQLWRRHRHQLLFCARCGFETPASRWQDLLRVIPIEGLP